MMNRNIVDELIAVAQTAGSRYNGTTLAAIINAYGAIRSAEIATGTTVPAPPPEAPRDAYF